MNQWISLFRITAIFFVLWIGLEAPPIFAQKAGAGIEMVGIHMQRYQDFQNDRVRCEIFGEVKNRSDKRLKAVMVEIEYQDESGKIIDREEISLILKVVHRRNARGEIRSIEPQEYGNFVQDTQKCPDGWLEGRFRYTVKSVDWDSVK